MVATSSNAFFPQLLADGRQRHAFALCQPHTTRDLVAQDAILCHQVLIDAAAVPDQRSP